MTVPFHTIESALCPTDRGKLTFITVKSRHLAGRGDISLFQPKANGDPASWPLVTLLHGVYGSHWAWLFKGKAHETLQRLVDEERIPPMLLATPSDGLVGDGSGYLPLDHGNYASWITEDIPLAVEEVLQASLTGPKFIGGLSMGGYGALRLGASNPDIYSAFSGHSSVTRLEQLTHIVEEPPAFYSIPKNFQSDVIQTMLTNKADLRPFRFDCGIDDELLEANRTLHKELTDAGIPHTYEEFPGGHEWEYWTDHIGKAFSFFADSLPPR
ncbi:MAG: alpha/beta hydrolase [Puniceicoccaceae bacterium]